MLLGSNAGDIIAALCPGDDIAVCCQQEIGIFDGGTAQLQLLAHLRREGILLPGRRRPSRISFPVIVINLQIKVFFFVFCRYI